MAAPTMRTYEPVRLIGIGGMGEVYEGRMQFALAQQRPCAIKLIRKDRSDDPKFQVMFAREAMSSMSVRHPNIVGALDFGVASDGRLFLILDFIRGPSVSAAFDLIDGDPAIVARIARDALIALQHLHECQLIHRDISPSNILIDRRGRAMVGDLGVVKRASGSGSGGIRGVAAYAAPEVRAGGPSTPAADLYSLGMVLFELLTGELPRLPLRRRARSEPPALPDDVPAWLVPLIRGLTHANPDERLTVEAALRLLETESIAPDEALTSLADEWLAVQAEGQEEPPPEAQPQATPLSMHGAVLQLAKSEAASKRSSKGLAIALAVAAVAAIGIVAGVLGMQSRQLPRSVEPPAQDRTAPDRTAPDRITQPASDPTQDRSSDAVEIDTPGRDTAEDAAGTREPDHADAARRRPRRDADLLE